jgi:hypothetical protein
MFKINLHSVVDVITNSSTQIYVQFDESALNTLKDLANAFLKIGNSGYTSDDLFTFELESSALHDARARYIRDILYASSDSYKTMGWQKLNDEIEDYYKTIIQLSENDRPEWWKKEFLIENNEDLEYTARDSDYPRTDVYVTCYPKKDSKEVKEIADILSKLQNLFSADEGEQ